MILHIIRSSQDLKSVSFQSWRSKKRILLLFGTYYLTCSYLFYMPIVFHRFQMSYMNWIISSQTIPYLYRSVGRRLRNTKQGEGTLNMGIGGWGWTPRWFSRILLRNVICEGKFQGPRPKLFRTTLRGGYKPKAAFAGQGRLKIWTEHSTLILLISIPFELVQQKF